MGFSRTRLSELYDPSPLTYFTYYILYIYGQQRPSTKMINILASMREEAEEGNTIYYANVK